MTHRRIQLSVEMASPLFVGGGTAEGQIKLTVDQDEISKDRLQPLYISKLSVDIVGLEQMNDGRK